MLRLQRIESKGRPFWDVTRKRSMTEGLGHERACCCTVLGCSPLSALFILGSQPAAVLGVGKLLRLQPPPSLHTVPTQYFKTLQLQLIPLPFTQGSPAAPQSCVGPAPLHPVHTYLLQDAADCSPLLPSSSTARLLLLHALEHVPQSCVGPASFTHLLHFASATATAAASHPPGIQASPAAAACALACASKLRGSCILAMSVSRDEASVRRSLLSDMIPWMTCEGGGGGAEGRHELRQTTWCKLLCGRTCDGPA